MKYIAVALLAFATLAAACPYDVTSDEPSPLAGFMTLLSGQP